MFLNRPQSLVDLTIILREVVELVTEPMYVSPVQTAAEQHREVLHKMVSHLSELHLQRLHHWLGQKILLELLLAAEISHF